MIYIAMLRGINVSGQKSVKMEVLREVCAKLGFKNVQTYVQSGNLIFEAPSASDLLLADKIETAILKKFRFDVPVVIRTASEMAKVAARNPFLNETNLDKKRLHVTFLKSRLSKESLKAFEQIDEVLLDSDRYVYRQQEIYLYTPNGYGKTKLSNTLFEKRLQVVATTRNWNTVNALCEMTTVSVN